MTDRFKQAYNALVKAFFEDSLTYADCTQCAVGSIVAHANKFTLDDCFDWVKDGKFFSPYWTELLAYSSFTDTKYGSGKAVDNPNTEALKQIKPTGYSPEEIALIENKFAQLSYPSCICEDGSVDILKNLAPVEPNAEMLYALVKFIANLDGVSLEFDHNPFKTSQELASTMVI